MAKVIGIDFGTTESCVAFHDGRRAIVIPNSEGSRTTPSVVAFRSGGEPLVGALAKRGAATHPENAVASIKRLLGRKLASSEATELARRAASRCVAGPVGEAWVAPGGRAVAPEEVAAAILRSLKQTAEAYLGTDIDGAVIAVPAYFDDAQRAATRAAGSLAGLPVRRILDEPVAASLAHGLEPNEGRRVAVYDLGGGGLDVSILEASGGAFHVRALAGDRDLGGDELDAALVGLLADRFEARHGLDLRKNRPALGRLHEEAERAKRELSTALDTDVHLPFIASDASGPKHLIETVRRSELEVLVGALIDRTLEPCRTALLDAGLEASELDEVILVGGQTRMPLVRRAVTEFFGRPARHAACPEELIALGAALAGAFLEGSAEASAPALAARTEGASG